MFTGQTFMFANPFWRIKFRGLEKVSKKDKGVIFIGNHQSFMDMPVFSRLPFKMKWVSKKELFKIPVVGWLMKMSGHVSIDRGKKTAIQSMYGIVKYVKGNVPVMVFPEGTRSRDGLLKPFKNGAFIIAEEHDVTLQPIVLYGTNKLMRPGTWKISHIFGKIDVSVLDPIYPKDFNSFEEIRDYAQKVMQEELDRLTNLRIQNA